MRSTILSVALVATSLGFGLDLRADTLFLPNTFDDRLFRYDLQPGSATLTLTLQVQRPTGMVITPWGELLVSNYTSPGSISRFLDPFGTPVPNGTIAGAGLSRPQELLFRGEELFVVNEGGGDILRFTFDATRNAVPNGAINANLNGDVRGIAYNSAGDELFVSLCCGGYRVNRYVFDVSGNASPNGFIAGSGLSSPHGMTFTNAGELLVANGDDSILRFTFDIDGSAHPNGAITGNGLNYVLDAAFGSWDELIATNNPGTVSRFTFDASGAATPSGLFSSAASYLNWLLIVPSRRPEDLVEAACPRSATYRNHGAYVSCVSQEAERLFASDMLTEFQKDAVISEAGRSEVGKRR